MIDFILSCVGSCGIRWYLSSYAGLTVYIFCDIEGIPLTFLAYFFIVTIEIAVCIY